MTTSPRHGARFRFDRRAVGEASAQYQAAVLLPDGSHRFEVTLAIRSARSADVVPRPLSREPAEAPDPPAWVDKYLRRLAKQLSRGAEKEGVWPRKLVRWHNPDD